MIRFIEVYLLVLHCQKFPRFLSRTTSWNNSKTPNESTWKHLPTWNANKMQENSLKNYLQQGRSEPLLQIQSDYKNNYTLYTSFLFGPLWCVVYFRDVAAFYFAIRLGRSLDNLKLWPRALQPRRSSAPASDESHHSKKSDEGNQKDSKMLKTVPTTASSADFG